MNKKEKIFFGVGFLLVIAVLIYPPVTLDGYSPTFDYARQVSQEYGSSAVTVPAGDYGESGLDNVDWSDTRRRFFFQKNNFDEDIKISVIPEDLSKDNPAEKLDGTIEWEGEIYVGRLLIEVLLISFITAGIIFFLRNK